ncbi:MAG: hypothetical protein DRN35_02410 [Thermoplasmata archaeon]|nr:MAG: hypothetical protein DRN28_03670 [Thermoplasmata archaeon]RLF71442.1 MAG: hypothetical protein DRN35_02410 [Thermoplasmata archaeon]RLF73018.1 MAG: hypothetical protein DRN55_04780 [Thermoplasmata archaeon]HDD60701.1 phosphatase PAP2 family protein [Euryarchaeota archaeon]
MCGRFLPPMRPRTLLLILLSSFFTAYIWFAGSAPGDQELVGVGPEALVPLYELFNFFGSTLPAALTWALLTYLVYRLWGRREGLYTLFTISYFPLSQIFKHLVGRVRPNGLLLSYPSGHVMFYCTVIGGFILLWGRGGGMRRLLSIIIFALIYLFSALSRVYVRAHWPSDTVGSLLFSLTLLSLLGDYLIGLGPGNGTEVEE